MGCPGQGASAGVIPDLFYFSLYNQPNYLNFYSSAARHGPALTPLPDNSQFKCYDSMHNWIHRSNRRPTTACTSSPA